MTWKKETQECTSGKNCIPTLYVYFENKEEIVGILVLNSMPKLYDYIALALEEQETTNKRYDFICCGLVQYQEEFPFYFKMVLDKVNIDLEGHDYLPEEKNAYDIVKKVIANMNIIFGKRYRTVDIYFT